MKISVNATLFAAVWNARSFEETRYYLNGIHFEPGCMVATDGHILTATQIEYDGPPVILPASKKAYAAAKGKKADLVQWDGAILSVVDANGATLHMEPCAPIDGTFPDWRRILPSGDLAPTGATFLAPVLTALLETARGLSGTSGYTMRGADALSPHLVTYAGVEPVFSVVMPARRDVWPASVDVVPDWTKVPE
jgi:hypothetical protein